MGSAFDATVKAIGQGVQEIQKSSAYKNTTECTAESLKNANIFNPVPIADFVACMSKK